MRNGGNTANRFDLSRSLSLFKRLRVCSFREFFLTLVSMTPSAEVCLDRLSALWPR